MEWIPLVRPSYGATEEKELLNCFHQGRLEGDGPYTKKIHQFFQQTYQIEKALFTTSCTDALELAALLLDIKPGDEVIIPSYTFVSTAHAFALRGAKIVFIDSQPDHPNVSIEAIRKALTPRTRAVVPVHYAGFSCEMDQLMKLSAEKNFIVIADAAQAIESKYLGKPAIAWGHMSTLSFHQTKNISCGEGGMLIINDKKFAKRAEILREKGTNRSAFFRGEVDKYNCIDIGSSYLGSDLLASILWAQLERREELQLARHKIWKAYHEKLAPLANAGKIVLPKILPNTEHNAHCYYVICKDLEERTQLITFLKDRQIGAVFHYLSLHKSPYYLPLHDGRDLPMSDHYTDALLRLPLFPTMTEAELDHVIRSIHDFFRKL